MPTLHQQQKMNSKTCHGKKEAVKEMQFLSAVPQQQMKAQRIVTMILNMTRAMWTLLIIGTQCRGLFWTNTWTRKKTKKMVISQVKGIPYALVNVRATIIRLFYALSNPIIFQKISKRN